ncbi:MAG: DUF4136 domain-containing protein [Phycisphaerae bacterium]|nr:DUF4136 domain-containing protein [Phycisphaerae bacterium]
MKRLWGLCAVLLAGGCSQVSMESFTDPDFREATYRRVMVAAVFPDLDRRRAAEAAFVRAMAESDAEAEASLEYLLPTRQYSDDEVREILLRHNFDAVLTVRRTERWQEEEHVPGPGPYYYRPYGTLGADIFYYRGGFGFYEPYPYDRGYTVTETHLRHEINLYDVASKRMAWIATSHATIDDPSDLKSLYKALAMEAVERLIETGLVPLAVAAE